MAKWLGYEEKENYIAEVPREYVYRITYYCRTLKFYYRITPADGMVRFELPKWAWTHAELMELNDFIDTL